MFRNLLKSLGVWTTVLKWREPLFYRVRLKGDLAARLLVAFGTGAVATAILLFLFAINVRPPNALFALIGMLLIGGITLMILLRGRSTAIGVVRFCEEGIVRKRMYAGMSAQWAEETSWPFASIQSATLIPSAAIGQSFSVLLLTDSSGLDILGIPATVDPVHLGRLLGAHGVVLHSGSVVPELFRRPLPLVPAILAGAFGLMLAACGFGFFVLRAPRNQDDLADARKSFRDQFPGPAERPGRAGTRRDDNRLPAANAQPANGQPANGQPANGQPANAQPANGQPANAPSAIPPGAPQQSAPPGARPSAFPPGAAMPNGAPFFGPNRFPSPGFGNTPPTSPEFSATAPTPSPGVTVPGGVVPGPSTLTPGIGSTPPAAPTSNSNVPRQPVHPSKVDPVGGAGGFPYEIVDPEGRSVIGFSWHAGSWAGKPALAQLSPLYDRHVPSGIPGFVVAREGYVVGGIQVDAPDLVQAIRIVFVAVSDSGELNKTDFYTSDWLGERSEQRPRTVGNGTRRILGIHGRRGAVINTLGVIIDE